MIEVEESAIAAIRSDLQALREKVDRMESMMESMIESTQIHLHSKEEIFKGAGED